jgi:hypothetical protein
MNLHMVINTVILDEYSHVNDDILAYRLMHKYIKRYYKLKNGFISRGYRTG